MWRLLKFIFYRFPLGVISRKPQCEWQSFRTPDHNLVRIMTSTLPPRIQASSGAAGAVVANAITYPLDLITTRVQLSRRTSSYPGDVSTTKRIIDKALKKDGITGFFSGLESDSLSTMMSSFLYFYLYSFLRTRMLQRKNNGNSTGSKPSMMLSVPEELLIGYISGVTSKSITTPLSVITVRLQSEGHDDEETPGSVEKGTELGHNRIIRVVDRIYSESGLSGFWKGMSTTIVLSTNPAFTMLFLQLFQRLFLKGKDRERPTGAQGFIGGAVSNFLAVLLLYPLILAKTRLQSDSKPGEAKKPNLLSVLGDILSAHGVAGLYQGLSVQLSKAVLNQGVTLMIKQRIEAGIVRMYRQSASV